MNREQVKGTTQEAAGKIQKGIGDLTNSQTQQAKGLEREAAGAAEKRYGDAKEATRDQADQANPSKNTFKK